MTDGQRELAMPSQFVVVRKPAIWLLAQCALKANVFIFARETTGRLMFKRLKGLEVHEEAVRSIAHSENAL